MKIVRTRPGHEKILARYYSENKLHFQRWSPSVPSGHHSIGAWKRRLEEREVEFGNAVSAHFIGIDDSESFVIGNCSLSNIIRGVFQSCHMGYSVAQRYEGQGLMKKIVAHAIDHAFNELHLHRIMANHMPDNERSAGLLQSLSFEREGYSRDYLFINGNWEDHVLNSLIRHN